MANSSDYIYYKRVANTIQDSIVKSSDLIVVKQIENNQKCIPEGDSSYLFNVKMVNLLDCIEIRNNAPPKLSSSASGINRAPKYQKDIVKTCTKTLYYYLPRTGDTKHSRETCKYTKNASF